MSNPTEESPAAAGADASSETRLEKRCLTLSLAPQPGEGGFSGGRRRTDQGPRWRGTPNGARDGGEETDHEGGESYWFRKVNGVDAGAAAGGVSPIHYAFQASGSQDSLDASEANHLGFLAGDASGTATDNPNMVALMEVAAHNVELKQQLRLVTLELVHLQSQVEKQQMHQQMDRQQQEWKSRYWTAQEHQRFLEALKVHGQKDFKSIASFVGSRSSTQVKTHAQKYFQKLAKQKQHTGHRGGDGNASSSTPDDEAGSTSREESRGSSGETVRPLPHDTPTCHSAPLHPCTPAPLHPRNPSWPCSPWRAPSRFLACRPCFPRCSNRRVASDANPPAWIQESGSGTGISTAPFFGSTEGEDMSSSLGGYCCSEESSREGRKSSSDPQSSASPASS